MKMALRNWKVEDIEDLLKELESGNYLNKRAAKLIKDYQDFIKKKDCDNQEIVEDVVAYLNSKSGKNFSAKTVQTIRLINGRLSEGRTFEDFMTVIDCKCNQWKDNEKMTPFLRPNTLFTNTHFEAYLQEALSKPTKRGINWDEI